MSPSLPAQPSLRQLQIQAKELAKALQQSLPAAFERLRTHHPEFARLSASQIPARAPKLHDAQLVIAREHGFESWAGMRSAIERVSLRQLVAAVQHGDLARARTLLRQNPNLVKLDMAENDEHRVLHYAVLRCDEPMVRALMQAGADAHQGIYPFRDATTAYVFAKERGFDDIVAAIEQEEQYLRQKLSCPNATVSSVQDDLYALIKRHDYDAAIALLEDDPSLAKACDREGGTVLHLACEEGALAVVDWLLEHHASVRKKNLAGLTPLEAAVVRPGWKERERCATFVAVAPRMLRHGALLSPLSAAALGDVAALRELYDRTPAALRQAHEEHRYGPVSTAVMYGHVSAVKALLELSLDPNERHGLTNLEQDVVTQGHPLWLAAAFGEYEMAEILLAHGADPNAQLYASGTPVSRAYGARDESMKTLLAAHGGRPDPYVIGVHRDVNAAKDLLDRDSSEETVSELLWAAACGGGTDIVEMTIGRLNWEPSDPRWFRHLCGSLSLANHAPHSDHPELYDRATYPECLRLILQRDVDVNIRGRQGETLMHTIVARGKIWGRDVMTDAERVEFARIALDASPDLTVRDELLKSTPLGWACRWGRADIVSLLLSAGAPVDEPDAEPWATPIAWAKKMGSPAIVEMLSGNRQLE